MNFFSNIFSNTIKIISFEDVKFILDSGLVNHQTHNNITEQYIIINTLSSTEQNCLIKNTLSIDFEENTINEMIQNYDIYKNIVIYGKNNQDITTDNKYNTLKKLGFVNVFIYRGGLFEWLLLQDIYGFNEFPTNKKILDILLYKPPRTFHNIKLIK
jgi:hypothetical protein